MKHLSLRKIKGWVFVHTAKTGQGLTQIHWKVSQWVASSHGRALRLHHQLLPATHQRTPQRLNYLTHDSGVPKLPPLLRSMWKKHASPPSVCFSLKSSCFKELEF